MDAYPEFNRQSQCDHGQERWNLTNFFREKHPRVVRNAVKDIQVNGSLIYLACVLQPLLLSRRFDPWVGGHGSGLVQHQK